MSNSGSFSSIDWALQPSSFFKLSYPLPHTTSDWFPEHQHYGSGRADLLFVAGWTIIFWLGRELVMQGCLGPFMRWWLARGDDSQLARSRTMSSKGDHDVSKGRANGYVKGGGGTLRERCTNVTVSVKPPSQRTLRREHRAREKKVDRFAEQGWSLLYYSVYWPFGAYIHSQAPYAIFDLKNLWRGWPHYPIPGPVKFYYLTQLAFWLNQLIVINIEARRKDYAQMMVHHIVTTALMFASYTKNMTRVGCLTLLLFDFCDILLPLAKMAKYLDIPMVPDIVFGIFMLSWLVTREGFFTLVLISVIRDLPMLIPFVEGGAHGTTFSTTAYTFFVSLLLILAILSLLWLVMIIQVALAVVNGNAVEDTRSDDEGDEPEIAEPPRRVKKVT